MANKDHLWRLKNKNGEHKIYRYEGNVWIVNDEGKTWVMHDTLKNERIEVQPSYSMDYYSVANVNSDSIDWSSMFEAINTMTSSNEGQERIESIIDRIYEAILRYQESHPRSPEKVVLSEQAWNEVWSNNRQMETVIWGNDGPRIFGLLMERTFMVDHDIVIKGSVEDNIYYGVTYG